LNLKLLVKYLAKECDRKEKQLVRDWLSRSDENQEKFKELQEIWESSKDFDSSVKAFDTNIEWAVLQNRIEDNETLNFSNKHVNRSSWLSLYNPLLPALSKVAALFVLAALVGLFLLDKFYVPDTTTPASVMNEISMERGRRGGMTLSDGTKVFLNSDSKIIIPTVFETGVREVFLEGEAYFDVAKNPNKPFVIKTNGATIEVLGTSFAVKNYHGDSIVQTVVEEGTVAFRTDNDKPMKSVILNAGNVGILNLENNSIATEYVTDLGFYLDWKDGYLKFKDEPMKDVAKKLERKYDIEVVFLEKEISSMNLTAELRSRSLERVLKTISMSLRIEYSLEKDRVSFDLPD